MGHPQELAVLIQAAQSGHRTEQLTLGFMQDILGLCPREMPIEWDTGDRFGMDPVFWEHVSELVSDSYSQPDYWSANSDSAYPSTYRGIYADAVFNCSADHGDSNVGHVLMMVNDSIGRGFGGYKGGVFHFTTETNVWGGSASWSSTADQRALCGATVVSGRLVLETMEL